jgi:hypothetical protein
VKAVDEIKGKSKNNYDNNSSKHDFLPKGNASGQIVREL